jgi:hypothetical protein
MADAMSMSFFKYGKVADAYPQKVNAVDSAMKRVQLYLKGGTVKGVKVEPGNMWYLVDAANFLMIESMCPLQPSASFGSNEASNSPGRVGSDGKQSDRDNQGSSQRDKTRVQPEPKADLSKLEPKSSDFYAGRQGD